MQKQILSTILVFGIASASFAGTVETPNIFVPPIAGNTAVDWSGFYAGINVGSSGGTVSFTSGPSYDLISATSYGAFVGYNFQSDTLVYGAELGYSTGGVGIATAPPGVQFDDFFGIKGRIGYSIGSALVYGVLGANNTTYYSNNVTPSGFGISYGVGVDYLITDTYFAGLEYLVRAPSIDWIDSSFAAEPTINTVQIRAGMKF